MTSANHSANCPTNVVSLYPFKGSNNDELCFKEGTTIVITQTLEGGWWEGTLDGKTGWFPSNYVKPIEQKQNNHLADDEAMECMLFRSMVLQNMLECESSFIDDMNKLLNLYIQPLHDGAMLTKTELDLMRCNLDDIVEFHSSLLKLLQECSRLESMEQRVGQIFLENALRLESLYQIYAVNHPQVVLVLSQNREMLNQHVEMKSPELQSPGLMTLTELLAKPLAQLERYPTTLKELQTHTQEGHIDRGDTQRCVSIFKDILCKCNAGRRSKELQVEVLTRPIKGWEGESISSLGSILHLSHVCIVNTAGDKKDLLMVLFDGVIVLLSASPRLSGYFYEGRFFTGGLSVSAIDGVDAKSHGFTVSSSTVEMKVVVCSTLSDFETWMSKLKEQAVLKKPPLLQISTSQPSFRQLSQSSHLSDSVAHPGPPKQTPNHLALKTTKPSSPSRYKHKYPWLIGSCLRPSPPIKPIHDQLDLKKSSTLGRRKQVEIVAPHSEDQAHLLKVIEAYCTSSKTRHTVNSLDLRKLRPFHPEMQRNKPGPLISPDLDSLPRGLGLCCGSFSVTGKNKSLKKL